jgi:transcription elongation factor Elf1
MPQTRSPKWTIIPDEKVRNWWKCPECNKKDYVSPDWYSNNGTPMCGDCDCDMEYSHIEVKK